MKGFGFNREKQMLVKALSTKSMDKVKKAIAKLEGKMSGEQIGSLLIEAIEELPSEEKQWAYVNLLPIEAKEKMHQEFIATCYAVLSDKGFEPGRDFWEKGITLMLKPAAFDTLRQELSDKDSQWNQLKEKGIVSLSEVSPIEELETDLGVPFGENILELMEGQLSALSAAEASFYLQNICRGVEDRTGVPLFDRFIARHKEDSEFVVNILKLLDSSHKLEPTIDWAVDLICAAGGEAEIVPDPEHPGTHRLTDKAWELLERVYVGPDGISVRDAFERSQSGKASASEV